MEDVSAAAAATVGEDFAAVRVDAGAWWEWWLE